MYAAEFSPDGSALATRGPDRVAKLWDLGGRPLATLAHDDEVYAVAFSPDGRHVVSGSWDRTLRLWNPVNGVPVGLPLEGHTDRIQRVAFNPDGMRIYSASRSGALHLWAGPLHWPDMLCSKLSRNMSRAQWQAWVSKEMDYVVQCPGLPVPAD